MNGLSELLGHFSNILAPVANFMIWAFPIKIYKLHDGEHGVILTFGKTRRKQYNKKSGIVICYAFEELQIVQAIGGFCELSPTALNCPSNGVIQLSGGVLYEIINPKIALLELEGMENILESIVLNHIRENIVNINKNPDLSILIKPLNTKIKKYGLKVNEILLTKFKIDSLVYLSNILESGVKIKL